MPTALLIQSELANFKELRGILEEMGHSVAGARTQRDGLQILYNDRFIDYVVVSNRLQGGTGAEITRMIKRSPKFQFIPVIITMHDPNHEDVLECGQAGASGIIGYPLDKARIMSTISAALKNGKRTILVVDDDPFIVDLLSNILIRERFSVLTAESGVTALEVLEKSHVHAVISDIQMPGMTGLELMNTAHGMFPGIPFLLITGHARQSIPREVQRSGAEGFLAKPFKSAELVKTLYSLIQSHAASKASTALKS